MFGTPTPPPTTVPQYVAELREHLEDAYQRVRGRMGHKLERQKELYNRKAHGDPFQSGDLVWLHSPAVARGQCRKLHRPWTGPYHIVRRMSDAVYRVRNTQARRQRLVVHFDRLKPCPPGTRIPKVSPRVRSRAATSPPAPPLGASLELLDSPDPPAPPTPPAPPAPRYPRHDRSAPDRLVPVIVH